MQFDQLRRREFITLLGGGAAARGAGAAAGAGDWLSRGCFARSVCKPVAGVSPARNWLSRGTRRDGRVSLGGKPSRSASSAPWLPRSNKARRIVLADADVVGVVNAAYEVDQAFGLLVDVLAVTAP